jgi:hypothetical protein
VESHHWALPNGLNADRELSNVLELMGIPQKQYWPRVIGGIDRWI